MKTNFIFLGLCCLFLISCEKDNIDFSNPANDYKILFISQRLSNCADWNLMIMNADGSDQTMITDISVPFGRFSLSHSGKIVAFTHYVAANNYELYSIHMDGTGLMKIDSTANGLGTPNWSPDDSRIIYNRDQSRHTQISDLIQYDFYSQTSSIIKTVEGYISGQFTQDNRILYTISNPPIRDIYIMNEDGSNVKKILENASSLTISPNGKQIAFVSSEFNNASQIFITDLEGNNPRQLTSVYSKTWDSGYGNFGNYAPHWTPDGKRIIYTSDIHEGLPEIYSMTADGRFQKRLTDNPRRNEYPAITPDGKFIVFTSNRDLDYHADIFVMQIDGGNQHPLTLYPGKDCEPVLVRF